MIDTTARLKPLGRHDVPELEPIFSQYDAITGFVPNAMLIMARRPQVVEGKLAMLKATRQSSTIDLQLADLVFLMASVASGCRYCQAHAASNLTRRGGSEDKGIGEEKTRAVWEFESSPLFTDAERAALRLARDSTAIPNAVADEHFVELRKYFTEEQILDIVVKSCNSAWINRFNDTMATPLEDHVMAAVSQIAPDWDPGKHRT